MLSWLARRIRPIVPPGSDRERRRAELDPRRLLRPHVATRTLEAERNPGGEVEIAGDAFFLCRTAAAEAISARGSLSELSFFSNADETALAVGLRAVVHLAEGLDGVDRSLIASFPLLRPILHRPPADDQATEALAAQSRLEREVPIVSEAWFADIVGRRRRLVEALVEGCREIATARGTASRMLAREQAGAALDARPLDPERDLEDVRHVTRLVSALSAGLDEARGDSES